MDVDPNDVKLEIEGRYGRHASEWLSYLLHDELFYERINKIDRYNHRPYYWAFTTRVRITMP